MADFLAEKYFWRWRDVIAGRKYSQWRKVQDQFNYETEQFERNCKCAGKTQRGRDCHVHVSTFRNGTFYCKYHF